MTIVLKQTRCPTSYEMSCCYKGTKKLYSKICFFQLTMRASEPRETACKGLRLRQRAVRRAHLKSICFAEENYASIFFQYSFHCRDILIQQIREGDAPSATGLIRKEAASMLTAADYYLIEQGPWKGQFLQRAPLSPAKTDLFWSRHEHQLFP